MAAYITTRATAVEKVLYNVARKEVGIRLDEECSFP